jgi:hypothetical protein
MKIGDIVAQAPNPTPIFPIMGKGCSDENPVVNSKAPSCLSISGKTAFTILMELAA